MTLANQHEMWALICEMKTPLYGRAYSLGAAVKYREEVAERLSVEDPLAFAQRRRTTGVAGETLTNILANMENTSESLATTPTSSGMRLAYVKGRMRASASLPPRKPITLGSDTKASKSSSTADLSVMAFIFMQVC